MSEASIPEPPVAVDGAARYTLLPASVRVEQGARLRELRLDDAAAPVFLQLPRVDLDDGRPLRHAAFTAWAGYVRASLAAGREFETVYRPPRPLVTGLAMAGATVIAALGVLLLSTWAFRPVRNVEVRPTTGETFVLLLAVAAVVGVVVLSAAAFLRAWRCRRGSYVALGARGMRTVHAGRSEPVAVVAAAEHHAILRCTRLVFADGRPDLWVPVETGALRRLDLLLAAVDDRLAERLRAHL